MVARISDLVFALGGERRAVAIDNIVRAGIETDRKRAVRLARRSARYFLVSIVETLKGQLQEKDRQIKELHILLQGAQEQTIRMLNAGNGHQKRWWWPFG